MEPGTCQTCGAAPATCHFTRIEHGKAAEAHVCEACVEKLDPAFLMPGLDYPAKGDWQPPPEDWLTDAEKADLLCPGCRHVNPRGWNYCSACGTRRAS